MHQYKQTHCLAMFGSELWPRNLGKASISDRYVAQLVPGHQSSAYTNTITQTYVRMCECVCVCMCVPGYGHHLRAGYVNDGHGIAWVQLNYL